MGASYTNLGPDEGLVVVCVGRKIIIRNTEEQDVLNKKVPIFPRLPFMSTRPVWVPHRGGTVDGSPRV